MYKIENYLNNNEQIIYEGRATLGKSSKAVGGEIFVIVFMLLIQVLLVWSVTTGTGDGANGINLSFIIIFGSTLLFSGICLYSLIYKLFLKQRMIKDYYYYLTNIRVLKYEFKNDKLVYGYLINYEDIHINSKKDNYGDVYMGIIMKDSSDAKNVLKKVINRMINQDPKNMPFIIFESVESPNNVARIAVEARKQLLKEGYNNNNII